MNLNTLQFPIPHACADCTLRSSTTDKPLPVFRTYLNTCSAVSPVLVFSKRRSTRGPHSRG